jgi:hypothetical protein
MSQKGPGPAANPTEGAPDPTVIRQLTPDLTILSIPFTKAGILKTGGRATLGN